MPGIAANVTTIPLGTVANILAQSQDSWVDRNIYSRMAHFGITLVSPIAAIFDACIGIIASPAAIFTLGMGPGREAFKFTASQLQHSGDNLLGAPFIALLKTLNPSNSTYTKTPSSPSSCFKHFLGERVAQDLKKSQNPFVRHIASRVMYFMTLVGLIILKGIDVGIAAIAVPLSLLCFGRWNWMNAVAASALCFPTVIHDIFYFTMKTLNPWAGSQPSSQ